MDTLSSHAQNGNVPTTPGIYAIVNLHNDNRYIGSAINLRRRRWQHFYYLDKGLHKNRYLQAAYNQYGASAFMYVVVENIQAKETLISREQYYIDLLSPEYNLSPIAGSTLGTKYSEESRKKLSVARNSWKLKPESIAKGAAKRIGYKYPKSFGEAISRRQKGRVISDESRAKMSAARKGKPRPKEEAKKSATSRTGLKRSPAAIAKTAEWHRGKKRSEEARQRISQGQKDRKPISEETRIKLSNAGKGRVPSEETRRKISDSQKGRVFSEETRLKMSIAAKNRRKREK